jgi:uncharacterized protein
MCDRLNRYKTSYYNAYIPIPEYNKYLVFNTITGGFFELDIKEGEQLVSWSKLKEIPLEDIHTYKDFVNQLLRNNLLVGEGIDETHRLRNAYLNRKEVFNSSKMSKFELNILPSFRCNMDCNYCYVKNKEGNTISKTTTNSIINELDKIISKYEVEKRCKEMCVTWNGGEPTLSPEIIKNLSKEFIEFCDKYKLIYSPQLISNGILLNESWHKILKESRIDIVQVTLDGGKVTHEKSRPLKNQNIDNYSTILHNLSILPNDVTVMVRVNADRAVSQNIENLMKDLFDYRIWPHRSNKFDLSIYQKINTNGVENELYLDHYEFYNLKEEFRDLKVQYYNRWAKENGLPLRKKKWMFPKLWNSDCQFTSFPNSFSVGSDGYIFKCWEHANIQEYKIESIHDGIHLENEKYIPWLRYNRFNSFDKCGECKYIMLCHSAHCIKTLFDKERPCSIIKYKLEDSLRDQYLESIKNPEKMESIEEYYKRHKN